MKPTTVEVYKFTLQAKLEHRRRVEAIIRRGLTGRAFDSAVRASEEKRDKAVKKFAETDRPPRAAADVEIDAATDEVIRRGEDELLRRGG